MDLNTQKNLNVLLSLGAIVKGAKPREPSDDVSQPTGPVILSGDALSATVAKLRTQANPWMLASETIPLHLDVYVAIDDTPLHSSIVHSTARATRILDNDEDPAAPILWLDCGSYRGFIGRPEDRGGAKYLLPSARVIAWTPLPPEFNCERHRHIGKETYNPCLAVGDIVAVIKECEALEGSVPKSIVGPVHKGTVGTILWLGAHHNPCTYELEDRVCIELDDASKSRIFLLQECVKNLDQLTRPRHVDQETYNLRPAEGGDST